MRRGSLCALLLLAGAAGATEVYRWTDADGVVHYTDQPPPSVDAEPAELPPLQRMDPLSLPQPGAERPAAEDAGAADSGGEKAPPLAVRIVSPAPDQTFRSAERRVPVQLALNRALPSGAGVLYYLDGNPQNAEPLPSLSHVLENVERGSHLIGASIVDQRGERLASANPVIVHVKPPTVN